MRGLISVALVTSRLVVTIILPFLRVGLISRTECVLLGGIVGAVVAHRSIRSPTKRHPPVGQDLGPTFGSPGGVPHLKSASFRSLTPSSIRNQTGSNSPSPVYPWA